LRLNPSIEGVYYNLGNLALGRGEVEVAIRLYRETLSRNPEFADAYNNLGQALESTDSLDAALRQYEQAVAWDPSLGGAWFNLGAAAERLDQAAVAIEAFRRAHDILSMQSEHQVFADRAQQAIERIESSIGLK
jgi:tetratricopeptide (TPR) repeat protein